MGIMNTATDSVKKVAEKIAGSHWKEHIKINVDELDQTLYNRAYGSPDKIARTISKTDPTLNNADIFNSAEDYAKAKKILSNVKSVNDLESKMSELKKLANDKDALENALLDMYDEMESPLMNKERFIGGMQTHELYVGRMDAYFNPENKEIGHTRKATVVGGYAAAAVGGRLLQGGSLTHNEYGERDIAGIPLI